jgi:hypothetical protein
MRTTDRTLLKGIALLVIAGALTTCAEVCQDVRVEYDGPERGTLWVVWRFAETGSFLSYARPNPMGTYPFRHSIYGTPGCSENVQRVTPHIRAHYFIDVDGNNLAACERAETLQSCAPDPWDPQGVAEFPTGGAGWPVVVRLAPTGPRP